MDEQLRHENLDETALSRDVRFWEIYERSFSASEKEPRAVIEKSVRLNTGMAFRTVLDGSTVAMATTHILPNIPAVFLVYLAVDPDLKGLGAGGRLLEFIHGNSKDLVSGCLGLVWEAERTEDAASGPDRILRVKRLAFFRRHGGRVVSGDYRQPALDGLAPVPMNILFRPCEPGMDLSPGLVQGLVHAIYFEKYQKLNGISPLHLDDLLAGAAKPRAPWD